ncbi:MAG TPA: RICIN domain-containing protein [Bacteroidales bacterium]|nr:RICIN domain-containing protein [Bacteroidales bacterium]
MNKNKLYQTWLFSLIAILLSVRVNSIISQQLAFPGAEGFGRFATGGRGGSVYHVTNLNDEGLGSFRDAVSQPNRIVVFDVGGIINISDRIVVSGNITIAGQTAPGDGVVIYGNGLSFSGANNTICRYLRVRMGKNGDAEKDAITIANGSTMIFDHVSVSWGKDENFSVSWDNKDIEPENITIQNSMIAQGLETHSCGGLIQTSGGVSLIKNLYIDNNTRNPKVKGVNQFVNNIVYNWGVAAYILGDSEGDSYASVIGNYFINGPSVSSAAFTRGNLNFNLYASNNYQDNNKNGVLDGYILNQSDYTTVTWVTTPFDYPPVTSLTPAEAYNLVIAGAGASLPKRDEVDLRLITELTSLGTIGQLISDEVAEPMNWPNPVKGGKAPIDTDKDGMPDTWEYYYGLNPYHNSDQNTDNDADGYTNVEEYLNQTHPGDGDGILSERKYFILARHSEKALDIKDKSTTEGASIIQNTQQKINRQIWNITNVDGNHYSIINDSTKLCLDIKDQSVDDSASIIQTAYTGDESQQWSIDFLGQGLYKIINRSSNKSLEVEAASTDDGIPLIQMLFLDSTNQHFRMIPSDIVYNHPVVSIISPFTGSVLTLGSDIQIEAYAEDYDGTISKVEFYHAEVKIGTDTIMPYTCALEDVQAGTYQISAVATDNDYLLSTASGVTFIVINGGGSPCTIQENKTGFCSVDGTVDNNNAGFTEIGFANTDNVSGAGINWKVSISDAGTYTFTWRYANGSGSRSGKLMVNNQELIPAVDMPGTGSWTTWTMTSVSVSLPAGESEIRLEATSSGGLANIDFFEVSGNETAPVFCAPTVIQTPDYSNEFYKIYPNPFTDKVYIQSLQDDTNESRIQLFDNVGKLIASTMMLTNYKDLDLKDLQSGIYYFRITDKYQTATIKLIKK